MKFRPGVVPQWPSSRGLMCLSVERLLQQRIVEQIDLADRQIVGGAPPGVDQLRFFGRSEWGVGALACRSACDSSWCFIEQTPRMARDHQVLIGRDDPGRDREPELRAAARRRHWQLRRALYRAIARPGTREHGCRRRARRFRP